MHSSSSKHWEKSQKDKENSKSPCKCTVSPAQGSSTAQAEKEPHLEEPPQVFHTSSQSHQLSKSDEHLSLSGPADALTPSKMIAKSHIQSTSSDSRHSMTPFEPAIGGSFTFTSSLGLFCSLTPATSVSGSSTSPAADGTSQHHYLLSTCKAWTL